MDFRASLCCKDCFGEKTGDKRFATTSVQALVKKGEVHEDYDDGTVIHTPAEMRLQTLAMKASMWSPDYVHRYKNLES